MSHPFHVPLPHNVVYMLLALLRRHAPLVYKTLELRKLVLDFLAPLSDVCNRHVVPFRHLQDAVIACGSLAKEICVARNVTEAPLHTFDCHRHDYCAIVPHGLRLRVFGPGRIRVAAQRTRVFGLLPGSNLECDEWTTMRLDALSWDDVFRHPIFVYTKRVGFPRPLVIDCRLDISIDTIQAIIHDEEEGIPPYHSCRIYAGTRFLPNGTRLCDNGVYEGRPPLVALCNDWLEIVMIGTSIHVVGTMFQG